MNPTRSLLKLLRAAPSGLALAMASVLPAQSLAHSGQQAGAEQDAGAEQHTLTVVVDGVRNANGQVAVALFDSPTNFPEQDAAHMGRVTPAKQGSVRVRFDNLEPGIYAVAILHDENSNGRMDFNFLGIPTEGYGFSNNPRAAFGPPSFDKAAFKLSVQHGRVAIRTKYLL